MVVYQRVPEIVTCEEKPSKTKSRYTWPLAMQARDVIGVAATGSGKTLAFLQLGIVTKTNCQRNSGRGLDATCREEKSIEFCGLDLFSS